jgi:aminopeptidase N
MNVITAAARGFGGRRAAALLLPFALACRGAPSAEHRDATARIEIPPARAHPPVGASIDVAHYALDVDLDPAARAMHATCTVRFVSRVEALKQVDLELAGLDVSAVRSASGAALGFARSGSALHVVLDRPLARGEPSEIAIAYGGKPAKGLWFAAERDGVPTEVFTQGECEDAHWWFPCVDRPDDRATSEIRVTMPSTWIAVAAGERIERIENGGRAIERWRMTTPHPAYLTTLVAGELATTTDVWDGVPLLYVTRPRDAERAATSFKDTADVLAFFSTYRLSPSVSSIERPSTPSLLASFFF